MTDIGKVLNERGERYGRFSNHAMITQNLKQVMIATPAYQLNKLSAEMKESLEMIMHKVGRILNGDPSYADSWVDIAGYAKLVSDNLEGGTR